MFRQLFGPAEPRTDQEQTQEPARDAVLLDLATLEGIAGGPMFSVKTERVDPS